MEFVQIIEYTTTRFDEIRAVTEEFRTARQAAGGPKPASILLLKDRDRPDTYRTIARFASWEEAVDNSNRPDTTEMAARISRLCDEQTFRNFDLLEEIRP